MAYQLLERPYKFSFSNNPVRYIVNVSNPEAPGCAVDFELYSLPIGADGLAEGELGNLITRQSLFPNPDGRVSFYCEDFLNSFLEWEQPNLLNDEVLAVTKQICQYYVRYRQTTRANPSPDWSTDRAAIRIAIKGGVAKEKFDRNNFFVNYLSASKPFLTWQPAEHFIGTEERRYLTYLHTGIRSTGLLEMPVYVFARVVYMDGTEDTISKQFPSTSQSALFHIPAGLKQLGLLNLQSGKKIWYYDVSVENDDSVVYAKPYRLYADYRKYYNVFSFIYHNSLGGIDTLRVRGDYDIEIMREFTEVEKATGGDFGTILPTENAAINISKHEVFKGDAGWLNTREMQDSLQDLLLSETVYRVVFGRWLKVMHLQKNQTLGGTDDTTWSFPLQWRYTFDNSQYTPFDVDFGAGSNTEVPGPVYGTCTAPGQLAVLFDSDVQGGKKYIFSWNEVAGAEGYELEYKLEDSDIWLPLAAAQSPLAHVIAAAGEYNWRLRTKCGPNDFSGYASGPGFEIVNVAEVCSAPITINKILLNIDSVNASVKLIWSAVPGVVGYQIEWRQAGSGVWNTANVSIDYHIVNLLRDVQYEFRVKSKCNNNGDYSGYTFGANFIPSNLLGACNAPSGPAVAVLIYFPSAIAKFTWNNAAGSSSYEIQYRIKGDPNYKVISNAQSGALANLGFAYQDPKDWEWRLRSNCDGGGFSNFVNGPDFNS